MHEHERKLRPVMAAIILVCFFMPFLKVSCGGQPILSVTGLDLATGKDVKPTDPFAALKNSGFQPDSKNGTKALPDSIWQTTPMAQYGQTDQSGQSDLFGESDPFGQMEGMDGKVKAEPTAAAALGLAAVALLAALASSRRAKVISAASAGICAVCLFLLRSKASGDMPPEAAAIIAVEWTTAFWVALIGSAALAGLTFHLLTQKDSNSERPKLVIQTYQPTAPSDKVPS